MSHNLARRVWTEQCQAAMTIKEKHGLKSAFDYLVAEKLINFIEAASRSPDFARELPGFVAGVRTTFAPREMQDQLTRLENEFAEPASPQPFLDVEAEDFSHEMADSAAERAGRLATVKQLLLATHLGVS